MSKAMSVLVLGMMLLLVGFVSAGEDEFKDTKVAGVIYNANTGALIADANVTVDCNGINKITTSDANGQYSVIYYNNDICVSDTSDCGGSCLVGDSLFVSATKDGMFGSNTGVVNAVNNSDMDLGIVHVPLVPEFGFFVGILTMISAVVVFSVVRRD